MAGPDGSGSDPSNVLLANRRAVGPGGVAPQANGPRRTARHPCRDVDELQSSVTSVKDPHLARPGELIHEALHRRRQRHKPPGSRCTSTLAVERSRHNALYNTRAGRPQRAGAPDGVASTATGARATARRHTTGDLTADHVVALPAGARPLDVATSPALSVVQLTKGAQARPGVPTRGFCAPEDRALLCVHAASSRIIPASRDVRPRAPQGAHVPRDPDHGH